MRGRKQNAPSPFLLLHGWIYHKMIVAGRTPILHLHNPSIFVNTKKQDYIGVAQDTPIRYYKPRRRS